MPTPYHPLTATGFPPDDAAMIWPWPHNWATAFVRRPEWKTAIAMSATGVEQRQALREYPRESITVENLLTDGDAATATSLLREWKGKPWLVPDWSEMTSISEPAGSILTLARASIPAGLALLGDEVVTLTSPDGTLDAAPAGAWPAGTAIVPLVAATLDDDQSVTQVTGGVLRCSIAFLLDAAVPLDTGALTRRVWPESAAEGAVDIAAVPGVYGNGLTVASSSGSFSVSRAGQLRMVGPHTIEFWVKPPTGAEYQNVMAMAGGSGYVDWNGNDGVLSLQGWPLPFSPAIPRGAWTHVAIARDSDWSVRLFLDGKVAATASDAFSQTAYPSIASVHLFGERPGRTAFTGVLDEVRMTHACRYTTDFTPGPCPIGEGDPLWSDVAFLLTGDSGRWGSGLSGAPTTDPRAVALPRSHNWAESPEVTVARPVDELDPGTGPRHTRPVHDGSVLSWSQREILDSPADITAFRAFLQVHRGSAVSFFAGPPGATIEISSVGAGLVHSSQARFLASQPPAAIAILSADGWHTYLISGAVTTTALPLADTAASHPPGTVLAARAIYRARLLGDAVEINYTTPGVAEVSLPLVAVAQ